MARYASCCRVRTLTVLFTDIVGSTALFSRLGEDAADEVRLRHFSVLDRAICAHGGTGVKRLGDGLMARFESGSSAVDCAVDMQRAVNADRTNGVGSNLSIRIGISSGDVADDGFDLYGEAVVEASRLCASAGGGNILVTDLVRGLTRGRGGHRLVDTGLRELKGLPTPVHAYSVEWDRSADRAIRVVLADDAVLVREGVARLLEENAIAVVGQAGDASGLLDAVRAAQPDLVITDIRMPPTNTVEGLDAAERIRTEFPHVAVLLLSQHLDVPSGRRLLASGTPGARAGVGYILKERVGDVDEFVDTVRRITGGERVVDPDLAGRLVSDGPQVAEDGHDSAVIFNFRPEPKLGEHVADVGLDRLVAEE